MRTYTEKELLKAVEYGCNYQKASDYQTAGHFLLEEFKTVSNADIEIGKLLDELYDTNSNKYYGYCTNFKWKPGIAVKNFRKVARVANIDMSDLITYGSGSDTSVNLVNKFILAKNRIYNLSGNAVWYVNETVFSWLEIMLNNPKAGSLYVSRQELMGKLPQLYVCGIPVRMCDAILGTESTIS